MKRQSSQANEYFVAGIN